MLRKLGIATAILSLLLLGVVGIAFAANPPGTGPPSQTCLTDGALQEPGHSADSPGSAFNEVDGVAGGVYSPGSQYDVACFQVSQSHP
jgi:hypothetical protein